MNKETYNASIRFNLDTNEMKLLERFHLVAKLEIENGQKFPRRDELRAEADLMIESGEDFHATRRALAVFQMSNTISL